MSDDRDAVTKHRKHVDSTVAIDNIGGEMNFISGEVSIELGGTNEEGADVLALVESIEQAVESVAEEFEASEYDEHRDS